ncbi:MAG TPA: hypothetical protein VHW67_11665 [Solirubrobacteraceae bacterium]|jgi:hypothetical protein|nr:hypothetical protein [Solirubrobacteraceae bacterium]
MHLSRTISTAAQRHARAAGATAICVAIIALLSALPAASAQAGTPGTPNIQLPVLVSGVPQGQLETLLDGLALGDLNATEVGKAVAELPALGLLPTGKLQEAVTKVVQALAGEGKTLKDLLTPADVVSGLKSQLESLLGLPELLNILKGQNLTTLLSSTLGGLTSNELIGSLLGNAAKPEQLVSQVLGALDANELEALLGSPLGGTSFLPGTVGTLASELGITTEALATELGVAPLALPPISLALTGALPSGTTLGILNGLEGLSLGLFTKTGGGEEGSGGEGGSGGGGEGGSGGGSTGGAGGSGSTGGPAGPTQGASSPTIIVNYPAAAGSTPLAGAASAAGKLKILSHNVKKGVATIVVQLPAVGKVTLAGRGVRTVKGRIAKAGRLTLRTHLTKAKRAARGRHRATSVKLTASFAQTGGPGSSANVTVRFAH